MTGGRDDHGCARLLEAALERDPLNLRAAEQLVELFRNHREDAELELIVKTRAEALRESYGRARLEPPDAARAFEQLSGVYEVLGDTACETSPLYALALPTRDMLPKVRVFVDLVIAELARRGAAAPGRVSGT